jgi:hypothetical protein
MNRKQLEHVLRASGSISGCREIVVIGSQAILGAHPDAPSELLTSIEVDLYPSDAPEKADLIDGCIGELSPFHQTFGYYAHGVGPETALLPGQWKSRLVRVQNENTAGTIGWCLSPLDLAVSKLLAGRPKDLDFVRVMLRNGLTTKPEITSTLTELPPDQANVATTRLAHCG